ncbi:MAG: hypothetical protein R3B47_07555, partial [Bacteroidia bacterium]
AIAGILLALSVLFPAFRDEFLVWFKKLVAFLGKAQTALVLALIFYGILFPLALFHKLFSKKKRLIHSSFEERNKTVGPGDFVEMW